MAGDITFTSLLRRTLPEASWPSVIAALHQDAIIWGALQDKTFVITLFSKVKDIADLTPSSIALQNLKVSYTEFVHTQAEQILEVCERTYEDVLTNPISEKLQSTFTTASLLALALADHIKKQGADQTTREIFQKFPLLPVPRRELIKTAFAILYGLIPKGSDLLFTLLSEENCAIGIELSTHIVLCDPTSPSSKERILWSIIERLPMTTSAALLRGIYVRQPDLAINLAKIYINHSRSFQDKNATPLEGELTSGLMRELSMAELLSLAGENDQAILHYEKSINLLHRLHERSVHQFIRHIQPSRNSSEAIDLWKRYGAIELTRQPFWIVQSFLESGDENAINSQLTSDKKESSFTIPKLARAIVSWESGDSINFRRHALEAIDKITTQCQNHSISDLESRELSELLPKIVSCFLELYKPAEAIRVAQTLTRLAPTQPEGFYLLARAARLAGYREQAVEAAQMAVTLEPLNVNHRRELAACLESIGDWQLALTERIEIIHPRFSDGEDTEWPLQSDLLALASSALKARDLERAEAVCREIFNMSDAHGSVHALLGEILFAKGDQDGAIHHLLLATQQAPNLPGPWLALSRIYLQTNQVGQAIQTLRVASQVVPYHPEIHLNLGKVYLHEGALSEAEKALGNAFEILFSSRAKSKNQRPGVNTFPDLSQGELNTATRGTCALLYGLTLVKLGFRDKAGKVLEQGYLAHPAYPGLANWYGLYLIEMEDYTAALEPFAVAASISPQNPECLIEYARLILNTNGNSEIAVLSLERALSLLDQEDNDKPKDQEFSEENLNPNQQYSLKDLPKILRDIQWQNSIVHHHGIPTREYLRFLCLALLAEAYAADAQLGRALKTYSTVLETPLGEDDYWRVRLVMGLGQTALMNNQPEIAIASLQPLKDYIADNPEFHRILSEAYHAMGFVEEGLASARRVIKLAPHDINLLSWYAEKALAVGNSQEASSILKRAIELDPSRSDLVLMLGKSLINLGETQSAIDILHKLSLDETTDPEVLYQTATVLSSVGKDELAASCLENALRKEVQPNPQVLDELTVVYFKSGNYELALKTIDRALECEPENTNLHLRKAEILLELERHQAALAILEHARLLKPDQPEIHSRIAAIFNRQGNLTDAYPSALKSIELLDESIDLTKELQIRTLATSIARSNMDLEKAAEILSDFIHRYPDFDNLNDTVPIAFLVDYYCLLSEFNLENNEEVQAARALNQVIKYAGDHPRILAMRARLAHRSNDYQQARHDLDSAMAAYNSATQEGYKASAISTDVLVGIVLAALDLGDWDLALELIKSAEPEGFIIPYLLYLKIKAFILRAEYARLCENLDIVLQRPADDSLSQSISQQIGREIARLKEFFTKSDLLAIPETIIIWEARSRSTFHPGVETTESFRPLIQHPDEFASWLIALSRISDSKTIHLSFMNYLNQDGTIKSDPILLFHYALAIYLCKDGQNFTEYALESIQSAIKQIPDRPYYHVLQAKLNHSRGAIFEALKAMEIALSIWPEEPRWCAYAAELAKAAGDIPLAISYLEKAYAIEPGQLKNLLDLGNLYSKIGDSTKAIATLQKAIDLAPTQYEPLLALASVYLAHGNLTQAARTAERAITMAPNQIDPLLIRGEVALQMNNPHQAESCAEAAIQLCSTNPQAYHLLARAIDTQGRTSEALEILEKALNLTPEPLPFLLERIKLLARTQNKEETLSALIDLSTKYPEDPRVLTHLAFSLAEIDNREEALRTAQRALHSSHDVLPLELRADLHYLTGKLLHESGQLDQAIHHISESIRYFPEDLDKYLELGKIQQESRQHLQALETYKKAILIEPNNPQPYLQAGLTLKGCRDYQGAENMIRRAAELAPRDRMIHRQLAALIALNLVHGRHPINKET